VQKNQCNNKCFNRPNKRNKYNKFILPILFAILPKCPFCILAYSSTIMMCSNTTVCISDNSPLTIGITGFFSALALIGLFFNKKGIRTYLALAVASLAISTIMYSVIKNGGQSLYYLGVITLFISIWINGSFLSILYQLKSRYNLQHIK
jgi:uncharacterized membrane protein